MDEVKDIINNIEIQTTNIDILIKNTVNKFCGNLDKLVNQIKQVVDSKDDDLTDTEIDDILLLLPLEIYTVSDTQELIGIRTDISEALAKEKYNNNYINADGKIADKVATAENSIQNDKLVSNIYSRCYKIIKAKVEASYELLNSIKRIQSRRIEMRGQ